MMILAYYIFAGLLSSTSGQTPVVSLSGVYVNKSETATLTCTVDVVIGDTVVISKDGTNIFLCLIPLVPCSNLNAVAAYSAVQSAAARTTTMTISAADISRDTGNWTCRYGTASTSAPVSLTVGTPPSITKMTEMNAAAVIETSCTFPYAAVDVFCSLNIILNGLMGGLNYEYAQEDFVYEKSARQLQQGVTDIFCPYKVTFDSLTCSDSSEAALTITVYLGLFDESASGLLTVRIYNGFLGVSRTGTYIYSFTATTTNATTTTATYTTASGTKWGTEDLIILVLSAGGSAFLFVIIIICCCHCRCCWLYRCRKDRKENTYEADKE